jgi:hypothetical protein
MPRRDGEVFRFGTAMGNLLNRKKEARAAPEIR